jgi:hypothetical protein
MPNDCENKLLIRGTHEDLEIFAKNHLRQNEDNEWFLDFNTIIPEPKTPSECNAKYVMQNGETRSLQLCEGREWFDWYSWRVDNWNTKWGAYDCCITENYDCLAIDYFTAWTPSKPIINKLIEMYTNLVFDYSYYECGCMLGGTITGYKGSATAYDCESADELREFAIENDFECADSEVE